MELSPIFAKPSAHVHMILFSVLRGGCHSLSSDAIVKHGIDRHHALTHTHTHSLARLGPKKVGTVACFSFVYCTCTSPVPSALRQHNYPPNVGHPSLSVAARTATELFPCARQELFRLYTIGRFEGNPRSTFAEATAVVATCLRR